MHTYIQKEKPLPTTLNYSHLTNALSIHIVHIIFSTFRENK